MYKQPELYTH